MELKGTYTFDAPRQEVWEAFLSPEVLANTLPGCEKLDKVGDNDYEGAIKVKVGPVQGKFQGKVSLSDLNAPESYKMLVDGKGPAGFMKGEGTILLEDQGESTLLHYQGQAQVGGRIASVGQRLIDSSSRSLTRQALENLHSQIKARHQAAEAPSDEQPETEEPGKAAISPPQPVLEAPSQTQFAVDVAKDVLDDLIPPERRTTIIVSILGVLALFIFSEWWINRVASRVASIVERRR